MRVKSRLFLGIITAVAMMSLLAGCGSLRKVRDIKALCDWFGIDYDDIRLQIEDLTIPTLGTLGTMIENGKDTSSLKRVRVGRFRSFQDFMEFFNAHYLPAVKNLSEGIILQKDMTLLRYFADDMLLAFGFDLPDEDGAK